MTDDSLIGALPKVSYGEGRNEDGEGDGMWWVRVIYEVGTSIEWFGTEARAKARYERHIKEDYAA